ncbi:MAG: phosphate propanoyltransferase [Candidatus Eremiobacteraeota bacterium]|nr:phosphate propanoyltransferase [Candidatus Eremiobacteraeota bacterium]
MEEDRLIRKIVEDVLSRLAGEISNKEQASPATSGEIPIASSNRHVHLSRADLEVLFGRGYELTPMKDLSQPGQFACMETVTVAGKGGCLNNVRVLGPVRSRSQVEVSITDCHILGIDLPPVRDSGDLDGTPGITLIGPGGTVILSEGLILAKRHLHMTPGDAARFGVKDKQLVKVRIGGERGVIFEEVLVRVNENFSLELHLDFDEANACGLKPGMKGELII